MMKQAINLILLSSLFGVIYGDNLCPEMNDVLCVEDILTSIATATRSINRTLIDIERSILENVQINDTFNRYMYYEIGLISSQLPKPQFHTLFFHSEELDRKNLTRVLLEGHRAMVFYYNSIKDILVLSDLWSSQIDSNFRLIEHKLKKDIICPYRQALNVYVKEWPSANQVEKIRFSDQVYPHIQSIKHDVRSIIIIRLLKEWMRRINQICRPHMKTNTKLDILFEHEQ